MHSPLGTHGGDQKDKDALLDGGQQDTGNDMNGENTVPAALVHGEARRQPQDERRQQSPEVRIGKLRAKGVAPRHRFADDQRGVVFLQRHVHGEERPQQEVDG